MRSVVVLSAVILTLCLSRLTSAACTNNSDCTSATPYCSNQTCVACLVNAHCSSATPHCTNEGACAASPSCGQCTAYTNSPVCLSTKCVQCDNDSQCAPGICDISLRVCRPPTTCTNSTACAGTDRPVCSGNKCVECTSDSDCSAAFPTCTAAGVCSAQKLSPILMCSKDATAGKRTLYTAFLASENVSLAYPVGSRNALYINGQNVLLNSNEDFVSDGTRIHYYPQSYEAIDITTDVEVTWYLDGSFSTIALNASSDCPTDVSFFLRVANLTFASENQQNITDTIANVLSVSSADVSLEFAVNKRSVQQGESGLFKVTVANGFDAVLAFMNSPTALTDALSNAGVVVTQVQGATLNSETVPVFDAVPAAPVASPTASPASPVAAPNAAPVASPDVVPITPVATFAPTSTDGVVETPAALDSGIIVAIVVVCVVVAAAVIIIAVVVSRNKKKKSGVGSSSRMERGSATELKETGSSATVTTANPAKKVESESSDDEESGEDEDSSDEDEESGEESGSEVSGSEVSGSGSNEGSTSAEGSGSNEGSSGSEESS